MQMTSELRCEETAKGWHCDIPGRENSKFKGLVGQVPQRQSQRQQGLG